MSNSQDFVDTLKEIIVQNRTDEFLNLLNIEKINLSDPIVGHHLPILMFTALAYARDTSENKNPEFFSFLINKIRGDLDATDIFNYQLSDGRNILFFIVEQMNRLKFPEGSAFFKQIYPFVNPHQRNNNKETILQFALKNNNASIVKFLLSQGNVPDLQPTTEKIKEIEILNFLISNDSSIEAKLIKLVESRAAPYFTSDVGQILLQLTEKTPFELRQMAERFYQLEIRSLEDVKEKIMNRKTNLIFMQLKLGKDQQRVLGLLQTGIQQGKQVAQYPESGINMEEEILEAQVVTTLPDVPVAPVAGQAQDNIPTAKMV
eukprot:snap_masked-scaffold_6-processed-gene-0.48-mRNA-1 protein AED:1.00 eAED:1.00 QI:0/-1/0/0/-1/1/1/0/317